jgi:hypothetical protein
LFYESLGFHNGLDENFATVILKHLIPCLYFEKIKYYVWAKEEVGKEDP